MTNQTPVSSGSAKNQPDISANNPSIHKTVNLQTEGHPAPTSDLPTRQMADQEPVQTPTSPISTGTDEDDTVESTFHTTIPGTNITAKEYIKMLAATPLGTSPVRIPDDVFRKGFSSDDMAELSMNNVTLVMRTSQRVQCAREYLQKIACGSAGTGLIPVVISVDSRKYPDHSLYFHQLHKEIYSPLIEREEESFRIDSTHCNREFDDIKLKYFTEVRRLLTTPLDHCDYCNYFYVNEQLPYRGGLSLGAYLEAEYIACIAIFFYSLRVMPNIFPLTNFGMFELWQWSGVLEDRHYPSYGLPGGFPYGHPYGLQD